MSSPSPLHRLATQQFDERYKSKQSESFLSQPEHNIWVSWYGIFTLFYWKNPIFTFGCFSLKAVYNSCKLQKLLQFEKFLFMYSFTTLLFRRLPTKIIYHLHKHLLPVEVFK